MQPNSNRLTQILLIEQTIGVIKVKNEVRKLHLFRCHLTNCNSISCNSYSFLCAVVSCVHFVVSTSNEQRATRIACTTQAHSRKMPAFVHTARISYERFCCLLSERNGTKHTAADWTANLHSLLLVLFFRPLISCRVNIRLLGINSVYIHAIENRIELRSVSIAFLCLFSCSYLTYWFRQNGVFFVPSGTIKMFAVAHFIWLFSVQYTNTKIKLDTFGIWCFSLAAHTQPSERRVVCQSIAHSFYSRSIVLR